MYILIICIIIIWLLYKYKLNHEIYYRDSSNINLGIFMWYDDAIKNYGDNCYELNRKYCKKYGISLIKDNIRRYPDRQPHWERLPLLLEYIDKYDYVMWIDADAFFFPNTPDIRELISKYPNKEFIFSKDNKTNSTLLQSGVFIVKNTKNTKDILEKWAWDTEIYNKRNFFLDRNHDQGMIDELYKTNYKNLKKHSILLNYKVLQIFEDKPESKAYIYHMAGQGQQDRYIISKKYRDFNI